MEAKTLQPKKAVKKGKIKKTIKNVLCRPDLTFWPLISDEQKILLEIVLNKYKVDIPKWNKPHWKDLKEIPKDERPKPPKIKKPDGLLFGISECTHAIHNKNCAAVIVESTVNPRTIVQPVIEACTRAKVPVVCLNDLKTISTSNFGITTSCLGIKTDCLPDLNNKVIEIAQTIKLPELKKESEPIEDVDICTAGKINKTTMESLLPPQCPYLYRSSKKLRVFTPLEGATSENMSSFRGQDFIEFSDKSDSQKMDEKPYKKMVLKKISNNPNRVKVK